MSRLYSTARHVLIDLGEKTEETNQALELIDAAWKKWIWRGVTIYCVNLSPEEAAFYIGVDLPDPSERERLEAVELPPEGDPKWL
ncbi:hypothetical protein QBC38DRAFT_178718 [Podospora fimiseda]|uniref:Uncharacterized protein n=1 Tax=Podospora fimiseda TaxID=252190 RepID=A0AAN7H855_9PEZI|nr:hypothetical protein QBC38DRAFT_178718 [Podospora fimiseda]